MSAILSLVMLAALVLVVGAVVLWRRGVRKQALLMLLLALVMGANLAIWTLPDPDGRTLAGSAGTPAD